MVRWIACWLCLFFVVAACDGGPISDYPKGLNPDETPGGGSYNMDAGAHAPGNNGGTGGGSIQDGGSAVVTEDGGDDTFADGGEPDAGVDASVFTFGTDASFEDASLDAGVTDATVDGSTGD